MSGVVIGIAAKNEEKSIYACLRSVAKSSSYLPAKPEIVVCLNHCTDRTEEEVLRFSANTDATLRILRSRGNLIDAQRRIFNFANGRTVVFIDADSLVEEHSISRLLDGLNSKVRLTYAKSVINFPRKRLSLVERIYRLYASQKLLTKRKYFHGRLFATNVWSFPSKGEVNLSAQVSPHLLRYGGGLVADDVYLSAYIIRKFGSGAIKEIPSARVYAAPIASWRDWRDTHRRTAIEVKKLLSWYPEYKEISASLHRRTNWQAFIRASLSEKYLWTVYLLMRGFFGIMVFLELLLAKYSSVALTPQWRVIKSTKSQSFSRKLIIFDIDGTLINDDVDYYSDSRFVNRIRDLMEEGSIVGIATHRSLKGSTPIYKHLALNGPLIVEGGGRVFIPIHGFLEEINLNTKKYKVDKIVAKLIKDYFLIKVMNGVILRGVGTTVASNGAKLAVCVSKGRKSSASIYVLCHGRPSTYYARRLLLYLRTVLYSYGLQCEMSKLTPGKLHVFFEDINKVSAIQAIRTHYYPHERAVLIGDDETEHRIPGLELACVKEGNPSYRQVCDYITHRDGSRGLIEILNYISE